MGTVGRAKKDITLNRILSLPSTSQGQSQSSNPAGIDKSRNGHQESKNVIFRHTPLALSKKERG